ncbi:MAG: hypothetical protein KBC48_00825 [Candidatus Pacebacteria bacterium]|nr:hypothetical protein [Candidatus Paceibacterota bacterium]
MNKAVSIVIVLGFIAALALLGGIQNGTDAGLGQAGQNVEIKDGIQYITINAGGGYTPKVSTAKAGLPTKLVIKTNGTYDCSSSLVIRSLGYQKILPQTGEEVIDVGVPVAGTPLKGTCGMGMYSFLINFT